MTQRPIHLNIGPAMRPDATGQRGAMFGIDARLALGVFGMLVVIAGYVAFGRIDTAKQAALLGEVQAFDLATMHFQADMGTFYPFTLNRAADDTNTADDLAALWDIGRVLPGFQQRWNGPYLARETTDSRTFGRYGLFYAPLARTEECTAATGCFVWLSLTDVPPAEWAKVNAFYDEGGGKYPEKAEEARSIGRVQAEPTSTGLTLLLRLQAEAAR